MGKLFLTIGLIGLCHAAYSATQHRNYLRLIESEFTALPIDILVQTLLSLLSCCFGVIGISTKFKPIHITSEWENKTWDNIASRTSFYSFNHRGKYLFADDLDSSEAFLAADSAFFKSTSSTANTASQQLTEKQKKERQNAILRQRLAEAHRDDQSSSSLTTSEEEEGGQNNDDDNSTDEDEEEHQQ